ncbi:MAG: sugar phosphate isomerase/epimerase [Lachnospiraceae bacterium]|nr:sugar phosphate isomerase/epimerase [Lachnospiraceae bacterium]
MRYKLAAFADEASPQIDKQIEAMKENGIKLLEIRGVDGENVSDISAAKAKEVKNKLDEAGLSCWSVGSPFGKIDIADDFEKHLDAFKHMLELCNVLDVKHIRLFSFYGSLGRFDAVAERLGKFLDAAKGSGIILCHENEKDIYGDVALRCLEIHQTFPEIKAIFDPANFVQSGQDTKEAWNLLSPYVEYMHIKDALPDGSVVPAGKGIGNLPYLLSNYKGKVLTIEPHLSVFQGLDKLEGPRKSKVGKYTYTDSFSAFKAATDALKKLIEPDAL